MAESKRNPDCTAEGPSFNEETIYRLAKIRLEICTLIRLSPEKKIVNQQSIIAQNIQSLTDPSSLDSLHTLGLDNITNEINLALQAIAQTMQQAQAEIQDRKEKAEAWLAFRSTQAAAASSLNKQSDRHLENALKKVDQHLFNDEALATIDLTINSLWLLLLDGRDLNDPEERETYDLGGNRAQETPGYIDAMESALAYILNTVSKPLNLSTIQTIYFLSGKNVKSIENTHVHNSGTRDDFTWSIGGMPCYSPTDQGIQDLCTLSDRLQMSLFTGSNTLADDNHNAFKDCRSTSCVTKGSNRDAAWRIEAAIEHYNQSIVTASSDDGKKNTIARLAKSLDYIHPGDDGNIRAIRLIILKLCLQNNLAPHCMHDPNCLDTHGFNEIVSEFTRGERILCRAKERFARKSSEKKTQETDTDVARTEPESDQKAKAVETVRNVSKQRKGKGGRCTIS
jgi:hypothetical protein